LKIRGLDVKSIKALDCRLISGKERGLNERLIGIFFTDKLFL
jgi:hypothetical protein